MIQRIGKEKTNHKDVLETVACVRECCLSVSVYVCKTSYDVFNNFEIQFKNSARYKT